MADLKSVEHNETTDQQVITVDEAESPHQDQEADRRNPLTSPEISLSLNCVGAGIVDETKSTIRDNLTQTSSKDSDTSCAENGAKDGDTTENTRRVTFPDGEDIILAYHEHPSPWHAASECTTEGLVAAYKKACVKFDVKPLMKLMQQLNAIVNFHDRNETLTLKGERLDLKHCETIEEVLRRVQFRTIDLEATHLDDESAIALFDMIEHYHSATRINISYNKLGTRGWQSCSRMLKRTSCMEQLDARCCTILEQVMPVFGRAIRMGSMVTVLHLENSVYSGRTLMILVAAIKMNEPLRELFLADNKLLPSDGIQLGAMLKFNHKLTLLDVRNNHLGDVGTGHICDGLCEQTFGTGLQTLVLWSNQVTYQAMNMLSRALRLTHSLETINIGHNNITNEGIHRLKESILFNKTLLRMGLQCAKLSCEGAVALAECVAESTRLLRLDLRENDIKTGGLMALSLALKVNQSVTRIDLDQKSKKESSVRDYAEQQQRLLADIVTYSQRNRTAGIQREQDERQRRLEQELKKAMQDEECQSIEEDTVEATSSDTTAISPDAINTSTTSPADIEPNIEPNTNTLANKPATLSLDFAVISRSASLESPVDAPSIEYPPLNVPPTVHEEREDHSPVVDFPPSPMVSSEGKTILSAALAEEEEKLRAAGEIAEVTEQGDGSRLPETEMHPLQNAALRVPQVAKEISRTPSPGHSPLSRRKFTIQRVREPHVPIPPSLAATQRTEATNEVLNYDAASVQTKGTVNVTAFDNQENVPSVVKVYSRDGTVEAVYDYTRLSTNTVPSVTQTLEIEHTTCEQSEPLEPLPNQNCVSARSETIDCNTNQQFHATKSASQGAYIGSNQDRQLISEINETNNTEVTQPKVIGPNPRCEPQLDEQNTKLGTDEETNLDATSQLNSKSDITGFQVESSCTHASETVTAFCGGREQIAESMTSIAFDTLPNGTQSVSGEQCDSGKLSAKEIENLASQTVHEVGLENSVQLGNDSYNLGSNRLVTWNSAISSNCDNTEDSERSLGETVETNLISVKDPLSVFQNGACSLPSGSSSSVVTEETARCDVSTGTMKMTSDVLTLNGINVDITGTTRSVQEGDIDLQDDENEPDEFEQELNEVLATAFAQSGEIQVD